MLRLTLALFCLLLSAATAYAHDVRPAYLEVIQIEDGSLRISLRQPVQEGMARAFQPELSGRLLPIRAEEQELGWDYVLRRWTVHADRKLDGMTLGVNRLQGSMTEVVVHVADREGRVFETVLRPDQPTAHVDLGSRAPAVPAYFKLGVEHILEGADHLAFVLGLILLVGINRQLVWAVTAFTAAHSLTLGSAVLGFVRAPVPAIEALVALSIVFVAYELVHARRTGTLTARAPWLIALAFGLLHGFAFAGALAEIGLPDRSIPLALLLFNLGVEAGQLLFVGAVMIGLLALRRLPARLRATSSHQARKALAYGLGCFASFLFVERTVAAFA